MDDDSINKKLNELRRDVRMIMNHLNELEDRLDHYGIKKIQKNEENEYPEYIGDKL